MLEEHEPATTLLPDAAWRNRFRRRLRDWFRHAARDLPWRRTRDPYQIWVSEVMLQQTQVTTVIPYFERFLASFPTVEALASASQEQVLRHWEGLGYYRRAKQLHAAANLLVRSHNGRFPQQLDAIQALPGIGRYTAGAIASIAFDLPAAILEANTERLYSRLLASPYRLKSAASNRLLWSFAETVLARQGAGQLNQAMMELGATICTPRNPNCRDCPVATLCAAKLQGLQTELPRLAAKAVVEDVEEVAVAVLEKRRLLLRLCGAGERWAGLWDVPRFPMLDRADGVICEQVSNLTGISVTDLRPLTVFKHGVTRFRITLHCYTARPGRIDLRRHKPALNHEALKWVDWDALDLVPLPTSGRKLCRLIRGE